MKIHCLLLLCWSLVWARPQPELKIEVEELVTVENPEVTTGYFEGDIELPKLRNAVSNSHQKWPGGIVYYQISNVFPHTTRAIILQAMREIESNTKHGSSYCVRFEERTTYHRDYIHIDKETGCHSAVGRQGGKQLLSLGKGCETKGTVMHELIHALGFWHEQSRYDRDNYVTIHTDNIDRYQEKNFEKGYSSQMTLLGTPYDFGSLMHYGPYYFAADRSKPSISPKPGKATGVTMGQRLAMSVQDVTRIQKLYQCTVDTSHITRPPTYRNVVDCNFEHGLCELTQDTQDDFDWTRNSGSTSTSHTGPNADHTNSAGYYLYAEANGHHYKRARLLTNTLSEGHYCLDFWLFQYGSQVGSFQIRVAGPQILEQEASTFAGSRDNFWQHYRMNFNVPGSFHLILQATIGSGDVGDIAIDDLVLHTGRCL